ncbi:MAG: S9 family peptidase, partial [Bacteroidetes bacterium]
MGYNTQKYVDRGNVFANWLPGDKFWYRVLTPSGSDFVLVDAVKGTRTVAFDHDKLAASLSSATNKKYTGSMLPFQVINYSADGRSFTFRTDGKQWKYDRQNSSLVADTTKLLENAQRSGGFGRGNRGIEVLSPDRTKAAFIKDYNLWVKDTKTNEQKQLTFDGIKDFGYATDNAGWTNSEGAILRWSPDSKKIATFKQDQR